MNGYRFSAELDSVGFIGYNGFTIKLMEVTDMLKILELAMLSVVILRKNQLKNPKSGLSGNPTIEALSRKQLNLSQDVSGSKVQS